MSKLSLSDWIRYLLVGILFLLFCLLFNEQGTLALTTSLGATLTLTLAGAFGATWYLVYRPLIHNTLVTWLKDKVVVARGFHNYRTYLMEKYPLCVKRTVEAEEVNSYVRVHQAERHQDWLESRCSGVYFLYLTGVLAFFFYIASVLKSKDITIIATFLVLLVTLLLAAWIEDRRVEGIETGLVLEQEEKNELKKIVEMLFAQRNLKRRPPGK